MKIKSAPRCIDNIFEVIKLFNSHSRVSSRMIAEELKISKRSAQRYIQDISTHLFIIDNGDNTYSYIDIAKIEDNFFKKDEKLLLYNLIDNSKSFIPKEKHETLERLKKLFMVENINDKSVVINEAAIDYKQVAEQIKMIEEAIKFKWRILFHYTKYDKQYDVSPYRILLDKGFWYLFAESNGKTRLFRIDYIVDIETLPGIVSAIDDDADKQLKAATTVWGLSGEGYYVEVLLDDEIKDFFIKRNVFEDLVILSEKPCIVKVKIHNEMELFMKLASYSPYYEILSENEREYFCDNFSSFLQRHKKS